MFSLVSFVIESPGEHEWYVIGLSLPARAETISSNSGNKVVGERGRGQTLRMRS